MSHRSDNKSPDDHPGYPYSRGSSQNVGGGLFKELNMKNYHRADCCKYCYNLDGNVDGSYFCSIFGDPIEFDFVCDDYADDGRRIEDGKDQPF
jgi:hypothetical protein